MYAVGLCGIHTFCTV